MRRFVSSLESNPGSDRLSSILGLCVADWPCITPAASRSEAGPLADCYASSEAHLALIVDGDDRSTNGFCDRAITPPAPESARPRLLQCLSTFRCLAWRKIDLLTRTRAELLLTRNLSLVFANLDRNSVIAPCINST